MSASGASASGAASAAAAAPAAPAAPPPARSRAREEAADVALSFVESAVHAALWARGVYPPAAFARRLAFGVPAPACRHPEVCAELRALLASLREPLLRGAVEALSLVLSFARRGGGAGASPGDGAPLVVEQY